MSSSSNRNSRGKVPARPRATSQGTIKPSAKKAVTEVFRAAGVPRRLDRDVVVKYEKRAFTPRLPPVVDEDEEKKKKREDDENDDDSSREYHSAASHLASLSTTSPVSRPYSSSSAAPPPLRSPNDRASGLYTFYHARPSSSSSNNTRASSSNLRTATSGTTAPLYGTVTTTISADPRPVARSTASRLASSVRRHLDMRPVREAFSSSGRIGRTLRLPGRNVRKIVPPAAPDGGRGAKERQGQGQREREGEGEETLARRLFGKKKPKRPKLPEGWLFGPPPE